MKRLLPLIAPAALVLFSSCVSSGDLERLEDRIIDLQDEVQVLKRQASSKEEVQRLNAELAAKTESILRSNADLSVKVDAVEDRIENTQGSIEQTNYRIDRIVQQIAQNEREIAILRSMLRQTGTEGEEQGEPPISEEVLVGAPPAPTPTPATADPIELYQSAYRDYQKGNWDLAIEGFQEFIETSPGSDLADNAAYWIGESYFSQQQYREAIEQFDAVVSKYPQSDRVPPALLKKGLAYIEQGQRAQGIVQLQYVVHEHPNSQEASLAREQLRSMGIDTP
ncbi:MAG: tol-pal system protein YbgF [Thermoanaerobaculia bacterium]|nr:tol-pal system protein YbgF [Thermoanaerobaculia bacterium]